MTYRQLCFGLFVLLAFALSGCGGGYNDTGTTNSPFAGNWSGPWNDPQNNQNGTINATIATTGRFTGTLINNTLTSQGNITGTISDTGEVDITVTTNIATRSTGTITLNNNQMTGTLQTFQNDTPIGTMNLNLTRQ